jgi:hypothetical protein
MPLQSDLVSDLVQDLLASPPILTYARNIATSIVAGPANHCAATLSALLVFYGIYPNGGTTGTGDLQPWVPSLAYDLEARRGWTRIDVAAPIEPGDVGVVLVSASTHHIYLVLNTTDQANPLIADNQGPSFHQRPVVGDPASNYSPTSHFLRAPGT